MTDKIVIISTCSSAAEAEKLARLLLDERLAACITVVPQARSYYHWKGAVEIAEEFLLLIKTSRPLFEVVRAKLEAAHSYEIPELLALPILEGSENYLRWLEQNLKPEAEKGE